MRPTRSRRSSFTLTAAAAAAVAAALFTAPAAMSDETTAFVPPGAVVLPLVDSAEDFDWANILASSHEGMVLERRPPNDWHGDPFPAAYDVLLPDGTSRTLPDLDPGYNRGFLDGDILTTSSGNANIEVRRRSITTGARLAGDSSPLPPGAGLVAGSTAGWVASANTIDGLELTFIRPDGSTISLSPPEGIQRRFIGAQGTDAYFFEYASEDGDGVVKRLDVSSGEISVLTTTGPHVGSPQLTPGLVIWTEQEWDLEAQQTIARICHAARSTGTKVCRAIGAEWIWRLVAATDDLLAWRSSNPQQVSVSSMTGAFVPTTVTGAAASELVGATIQTFGDGFAVHGSRGRIWRFGAAATATVLDQSEPRPAQALGLALAPGRLIGTDNRRVLDEGEFIDSERDNTYAAWSRSVTLGPTLSVGPEQSLAEDVRRAGYGSAVAASSSRTVRVTRRQQTYPASCTVTVTDENGPSRSVDLMVCEGSVMSGPYYSRELTGPPWGTDAIVSLDGRVLQKLAWPTDGTVALFGSRAAWVDRDGAFWYRDLETPETSSPPRLLRAAECEWSAYANAVSIWGRHVVVAPHCASHAYLYDLVTGSVRELPAMRSPKLVEGGIVWSQPDSVRLMALDLTSASASPVQLGEVNPWFRDDTRPRFTVDDHLVAWQDHPTGRVVVAPLPFGQAVAHRPRLLGTIAPTTLAAAPSGQVTPWRAEFDVTKPLGSWRLDLRNATGAVVRTWTGAAPHGGIRVDWDGRISASWAPGGRYTWTLTGAAADGEGTLRNLDGAQVPLTGGLVVRDAKVRDLGSDRIADLLGVDAKGAMWRYDGTASGGLKPRVQIGSGWGGMTPVVNVGDLSRDGRPDLVARDSAGTLWRYDGNGAGGLRPRVKLATGWNIYSTFVGAGDLTGDGRPDVLARDTTGRMWRYDGTSAGGLRPRVSIGSGWNAFTAVVAVGDLTSDGRPDLLVRDRSGVLARYDGTGTGSYRPRVMLGGGWNAFPVLTGIGDVDGDGASDLLARDASGVLWRYPGTGTGGFAPRKVSGSSGWQIYPRLL